MARHSMIRRLLIPLLGSGLLVAASAGSAFAKCEMPNPTGFCLQEVASMVANMSLGSTGAPIRAGSDTPFRVWISRGDQPADARSVTLVFARTADPTMTAPSRRCSTGCVRAEAAPSGEPGEWRATVNLPAAGDWTVVAEVFTFDATVLSLSLDVLRVTAAPSAPVVGTPATPIGPAPPPWPIALVMVGVAGAAAIGIRLRLRSRRRPAAA